MLKYWYVYDADFKEEDHKRGPDGKFIKGDNNYKNVKSEDGKSTINMKAKSDNSYEVTINGVSHLYKNQKEDEKKKPNPPDKNEQKETKPTPPDKKAEKKGKFDYTDYSIGDFVEVRLEKNSYKAKNVNAVKIPGIKEIIKRYEKIKENKPDDKEKPKKPDEKVDNKKDPKKPDEKIEDKKEPPKPDDKEKPKKPDDKIGDKKEPPKPDDKEKPKKPDEKIGDKKEPPKPDDKKEIDEKP